MIRVIKSLIISHGILDLYKSNWIILYLIFPMYFLFLDERIIQGLIFFGTVIHFSKDLTIISYPYSEILISFLLLLGYKFRGNKNTILGVYIFLFLHSVRYLYININEKEKMLVLSLFFIFVNNCDYLINSVDYLINNPLIMNKKNRLILGVVMAHVILK